MYNVKIVAIQEVNQIYPDQPLTKTHEIYNISCQDGCFNYISHISPSKEKKPLI